MIEASLARHRAPANDGSGGHGRRAPEQSPAPALDVGDALASATVGDDDPGMGSTHTLGRRIATRLFARGRAWWTVSLGLVLLVTISVFGGQLLGEWRWVKAQARLADSRAAWHARTDFSRPSFDGIEDAGNAWEAYDRANEIALRELKPVRSAPRDHVALEEFEELPSTEIRALANRTRPAFEWIRRGARRTFVRLTLVTEGEVVLAKPPPFASRSVIELRIADQRLRRRAGESVSVDDLLAALQWAEDLVLRSPRTIDHSTGLHAARVICGEGFDDDTLAQLPPSELERIAAVVAATEARLPCEARAHPWGIVFPPIETAEFFRRHASLYETPRWLSWRYGFSQSAMLAEAVERSYELPTESARRRMEPWQPREAEMRAATEQMRATNPFVSTVMKLARSSESEQRTTLSSLRMLLTDLELRLDQRPTPRCNASTGAPIEVTTVNGQQQVSTDIGGRRLRRTISRWLNGPPRSAASGR